MDKQESILKKIENHPYIKYAVTDIDGILRSKVISLNKFKDVIQNGVGFCDVIFGWDNNDQCYNNGLATGWQTGYPDAKATIDLNTLRFSPTNNNTPFFLADMQADNHMQQYCPRTLLKNVIAKAEKMGFKALFSQEFEWFNFHQLEAGKSELKKDDLKPLSSGMFGYSNLRPIQNKDYFNSLFHQLQQMDIPLEGLHTETGPGVYEAAIQYDEVLQAADKAVLFKTTVKEIAHQHQITASFMAKWNAKLPGCSGHLHQSLWDINTQKNLFSTQSGKEINKLTEHYMAGVLHTLPVLLPLYAPTINSYKRLNGGDWAPNNLSWGYDNRTTALRVLPNSGKSARLELRVPGSDSNPYLAMAAALASGLYGIEHKLELNTIPTTGNAYTSENKKLPTSLLEATLQMQNSNLPKTLLGEQFIAHFIQTRLWECQQHEKAVSDWEINRYFEII